LLIDSAENLLADLQGAVAVDLGDGDLRQVVAVEERQQVVAQLPGAGTLTRIGDVALTVKLDRGAWVEPPERYAREGRLDHGCATTAHRARGATVDRAFVLGSDGLYRERGHARDGATVASIESRQRCQRESRGRAAA